MRNNLWKSYAIVAIFLCSISFASITASSQASSCLEVDNNLKLNSGYSATKSVEKTLNYGQYHAISSGQYIIADVGSIDWSFASSNLDIGIKVMILDSENYQTLQDGLTPSGHLASGGSQIIDAGSWTPSTNDTYFVVFFNEDADQESSTVSMSITFRYGYTPGWFIALLIGIPAGIVVFIILLILIIVLVLKRAKKKQEDTTVSVGAQTDIHSPKKGENSFSDSRNTKTGSAIHCPNCGSKNNHSSSFCIKCGTSLDD